MKRNAPFRRACPGLLLLPWLLAFFLPAVSAQVETEPEKVGDLGVVSALKFDGATGVSADSIRRSLRVHPDYIRASHPAAPYPAFRETVIGLVRRGYLAGGYPDVTVTAVCETDAGVTRVTVKEGPKFVEGRLLLEGDDSAVPFGLLEKSLTEATDLSDRELFRFLNNRSFHHEAAKTLDLRSRRESQDGDKENRGEAGEGEEDEKVSLKASTSTNTNYFGYAFLLPGGPIPEPGSISDEPSDHVFWEEGETFSFVDSPADRAARAVRKHLSAWGYFSPEVEAEPIRNEAEGTVDLRVKVNSVGPQSKLGGLRVDGLERHQPGEVAAFLGLEEGTPFSRALLLDAERKLIGSGRFIAHWFEISQADGRADTIDLTLTVTEYQRAPRLGEALSDEETAALRFAEWMSTLAERDEDLVLTIEERSVPLREAPAPPVRLPLVRMILSPAGGLAISTGDGPDASLLFGEEQFGIYRLSGTRKTRAVSPPFQGSLIPSIALYPSGKTQTSNSINLSVNARGSRPDHMKTPLDTRIYVAPVVGLQLLANPGTRVSKPKPGVLLLTRDDETVRRRIEIDMETGRLLSMLTNAGDPDAELRLVSRTGALDEELRRVRAGSASLPNDYDEDRPIGSLFIPVIQGILQSDILGNEKPELADSFVRHLDDAEVTEPFETLIHSWWQGFSAVNEFSIPLTREKIELAMMNPMFVGMAVSAVAAAEPYLPKDSWLWKTVRETVHLYGDSPYTGEILDELDSDAVRMGPVGYLVNARILKLANSPQAHRFAWAGLERLEARDFREDWQFIFDPDSPVPVATHWVNLMEAFGRIYAGAGDAETRELGDDLVAAAGAYREGRPERFLELAGQSLDRFWEAEGRKAVEKRLRSSLQLPPDLSLDSLAAAVDDMPILETDVRSAAFLDEVKPEEALESLIADKPLLALFGKLGGKFPPELIDQRIQQLVAARFGGDSDRLEPALEKASVSLDHLKQVIGTRIAAEAVRGKIAEEMPAPADEKMRVFLRDHPEAVTAGPAVRLHSIAVPKSAAGKKAIDAAHRAIAVDAKKFVALAKEVSQDSKAAGGGDWGWVDPKNFNETIAGQIRNLEGNALSPVFEDGDFYRLVRVTGRRDGGPAAFEELDAKARQELARIVRRAQVADWEKTQKEGRFVRIFESSGR